jgi:DNA-binding NarL/FixJ family response regulator
VLALIARGQQNPAVAAQLGLSVKTVGHYVRQICANVGVSMRPAALLFGSSTACSTDRANAR